MRHEHVMDGLFARGMARPPTESRALTGRSVAMQHARLSHSRINSCPNRTEPSGDDMT